MHDLDTAESWAKNQDMDILLGRWSWFKGAVVSSLTKSASQYGMKVELDTTDLASAFFEWAAYRDMADRYREINPRDCAHFLSGSLLKSLVRKSPIRLLERVAAVPAAAASETSKTPEIFLLFRLSLTVLAAQYLKLGSAPPKVDMTVVEHNWNSFIENAREDANMAIPFFDVFFGLQPNWQAPDQPSGRVGQINRSI